jgi:hypothetical protein
MQTDFDRVLTAWLADERPRTAPSGLIDHVIDRVAETDRRPGWLVLDRWTWQPGLRVAAALILLLLALAAALIVGSALLREDLPIVHGQFTRLGPLTTEGTRQAIPLSDGRVLLVGTGSEPSTGAEFGVAEIFDPATGRLQRLEEAPVIRRWAGRGAVLLSDGRVLLTGGTEFDADGGNDRPAPAEIIDPSSGSITIVGQMVHPRYGHTATLLEDGRVLLAGGDVGGNITEQNPPAELFDPQSGTFRAIDPLQHARLYHVATRLYDGRVLLSGGLDGTTYVTEAEAFDPASETFDVVGSMSHSRVDHSATLLDDGRVLLVGGNALDDRGFISDDALASAELFDPATGAFSEIDGLTTERSQHAAVLLSDKRVLIAGGYNTDGAPSTTELFDPGTGRFVRGADTLDRLGGPTTAALLPDGQVFVIGDGGRPELFDPSTVGRASPTPGPRNGDLAGTVTAIDGPAVERYGHTATLLRDGRVLVVGGNIDDRPIDSAELYDPRSGRWSATGSLNEPRAWHRATLLDDGRVLVAGGREFEPPDEGGEFRATDSAEIYDPTTEVFTPAGRMTVARGGYPLCCGQVAHFPTTVLADGRVLIAGGSDKPGLDLFDPRTNTFTGVRAGCQGSTIQLPDGRILLGCGGGYVFDPASGEFGAVTDLDALRQLGTRLPDGRILFSDAVGNEPLVFDPTTFVPGEQLPWSSSATFVHVVWDRFGIGSNVQTLTPLPDGRILVFARRPDETNHPLQRGLAAIFDPHLVTFTEVASPAGRFANSATMLQDGRILFVGKPVRSPDRTDPQPVVAELLDLGLPR